MKQKGYMIIKVGKCIDIYLFAKDRKVLEEEFEFFTERQRKARQIVELYEDGEKRYLKIEEKFVRIA